MVDNKTLLTFPFFIHKKKYWGNKAWHANDILQTSVTHECFRNKDAPNDLLFFCFCFFGRPGDTSCWSQRQSNSDITCRQVHTGAMRCMNTTGLCAWEFVGDGKGERCTEKDKGWKHARVRRCRNSSRAAINPDTKGQSCAAANMRSLASALAQLHWLSARAFFPKI